MEMIKTFLVENSNWLIPIGSAIAIAILDFLIAKSKSKNNTLLESILKIFKREITKKKK